MLEPLGGFERKFLLLCISADKVSGEGKDMELVLWNSLEGGRWDTENWKTLSKWCAQMMRAGRTERTAFKEGE